ncbi:MULTISPECIES: nuclear transport factor 2 family protein [Arthrobacter]|uniref:SnoaL-like domain-containing protein n=1 Tax=Arthrobacter oryzae TaxID=409290 RepID=A0A3N0C974_9MICC|nr:MULTISPECIES: nuclear transport factor 2 family protein [Arthrobacter]QYF88950.1 nuclear transport factor 2 family protein [Arthrobacter sp. PAMC25284]RNL59839.1 hypothetical protein D7003_02240 [Arthrobacter oryzae]
MGTTENVDLVRRGYEAFNAGDMATLTEIFAEDAVWHVAGNNVLSGTKQGRDAVLAYFGELGARSAGTLKVDILDIVGGDRHTVGIQHNSAENNGRSMDLDVAIAFEIRDGRITAGQEFIEDTAKSDEFWAA